MRPLNTSKSKLAVVLLAVIFAYGCSDDDDGNVVSDPCEVFVSFMRVTTDPATDEAPAVSPDAPWITFVSSRGGGGYRIWRVLTAEDADPPEQLTTRDASSPQYSTDGSLVYFWSNEGTPGMYSLPAEGGTREFLPGIPRGARFSPDGQWFVYSASAPGLFDPSHIWKQRADLSEPPVQLTTAVDGDRDPSWCPSGDSIVFSRGDPADTDAHLYLINADGSGLRPLTDTTQPVEDSEPACSPDGQWIAFERGSAEHESRIFKVRASGETASEPAIQLSFNPDPEADDSDPAWSPDGCWITFTGDRGGNYDIYIMPVTGEPLAMRRIGLSPTAP
jgi:Tol biopolymer transport system component